MTLGSTGRRQFDATTPDMTAANMAHTSIVGRKMVAPPPCPDDVDRELAAALAILPVTDTGSSSREADSGGGGGAGGVDGE